MNLTTLTLASAAVALLGSAAFAQPAAPTPGHDKQYQSKVVVPVAELPASVAEPAPTVSATSTIDAPAASIAGADVSAATFTNITVTNGPVPDTAENRAKYGQPMSRAGKRTAARGN